MTAAFLLALAVQAADPPQQLTLTEEERYYVIALEVAERRKIDELRVELRRLETRKIRTSAERKYIKTKTAELEAQIIADLKGGTTQAEPELPMALAVGAVGKVRGKVLVHQILGKESMRVTIGAEQSAILNGISTEGLVDNRLISIDKTLICDGTKTYKNVLGAGRTVFVLRPLKVDPARVEKAVRLGVTALAEKAPAKPSPEPVRKRGMTTADPEHRLKSQLANAKVLAKAKLYEAAETKLRQIIAEGKGTPIAEEAQKELDGLPAKVD